MGMGEGGMSGGGMGLVGMHGCESSLGYECKRGSTLQADTARVKAEHDRVTREGWASMDEGVSVRIVRIYSNIPSHENDESCCSEAAGVLAAAFSQSCQGCVTVTSAQDVAKCVLTESNYEIISVSRVQNIPRAGMHASFRREYNIENTRTVYHGTNIIVATNTDR